MDAYEPLRVIGRGSYGCAILVRPRESLPAGGAAAATSGTSSGGTGSNDAPHQQRLYVIKQISLAALESEADHALGLVARPQAPAPPQQQQQQPPQQLDQPQILVASPAVASGAVPHVASVGAARPLRSPHQPTPFSPLAAPVPPLQGAGASAASSLLNEVQVLMRVGDGHPNICRFRGSFFASSSSSSSSSSSAPCTPRGSGAGARESGFNGSAGAAVGSPSRSQAMMAGSRGYGQGREKNDLLCIVMDWYAGGDLSRKIKRRKRCLPPPPPQQLPTVTASSAATSTAAAPAPTTLGDHLAAVARSSTAGSNPDPSISLSSSPFAPSPALVLPAARAPLFPEDVVLDYLVQLLLGLQHIHARNVLHRDLKTSNIFISLERPRPHHRRRRRCATPKTNNGLQQREDGAAVGEDEEECVEVLRIGDFGIARIMDSGDALAKTRIGTPYFLAPEVVSGQSYSLKADVWSLGCVLFQMLTGEHAFGAAKNLNNLVMAIVRGDIRSSASAAARRGIEPVAAGAHCCNLRICAQLRGSPASISPSYSPRMTLLLSALLQKDPSRRPSAAQLLMVPFLRERVAGWLSARRIAQEFGTSDLARLPEFSLAPTTMMLPPLAIAEEHGDARRQQPPRQPLTPQPRLPGSSRSSGYSGYSELDRHRHPESKPRSSSVSAERSPALSASASSSYAAVHPSKLHPPPTTRSSAGATGGGSGSSHSSSTPSPLPALISRPLSLPPTPSSAALAAAAATAAARRHSLPQQAEVQPQPPLVAISSAARADSAVSSEQAAFQWRELPSSLAAQLLPSLAGRPSHPPPPPPSVPLSLQCEQVRAFLEQHIDLATLKRAYRMLVVGSGGEEATATPGLPVQTEGALQLMEIGQSHLMSLLRQLVAAEQAHERAMHGARLPFSGLAQAHLPPSNSSSCV